MLALVNALYQHTDTLGHYARATFVDFSSAFNTMQLYKLIEKLKNLNVKRSLIAWIYNFLHERIQKVKVNDVLSDELVTNTGAPQGCVLSPSLFILYTNDCVSNDPSVHVLKYADDTVILGLINENENAYREHIASFGMWCKDNHLVLNSKKTKEMIFDFRKKKDFEPHSSPIVFDGDPIEYVHSYRYLGTEIDDQLSWGEQTKTVSSKCNQRLYFLRKLKQFKVNEKILWLFYTSVLQSIITHDSVIWFNNAKQKDLVKVHRVIKQSGKITKHAVDLNEVCKDKVIDKARSIITDDTHPLHNQYNMMRSGRRLKSIRARTSRFLNSFVPYSIRLLNDL